MATTAAMILPILLYHLILEDVITDSAYTSTVTQDVTIPLGCLLLCMAGFVFHATCKDEPAID
jgi:hypothetical protein